RREQALAQRLEGHAVAEDVVVPGLRPRRAEEQVPALEVAASALAQEGQRPDAGLAALALEVARQLDRPAQAGLVEERRLAVEEEEHVLDAGRVELGRDRVEQRAV